MAVKHKLWGREKVVTQRDEYTESKEMRGKRNEEKIKLDSSSLTLTKCLQKNIHIFCVSDAMRWPCNDFPDSDEREEFVVWCVAAWARESHIRPQLCIPRSIQTFFFCVRIFCGTNSEHISAQNSEQMRIRSMSFHFAWWESSFFVHLFCELYTLPQRGGSPARPEAEISISLNANRKKTLIHFSIPTLEKPPKCRAWALWGEINTEQHYSCSRGAV